MPQNTKSQRPKPDAKSLDKRLSAKEILRANNAAKLQELAENAEYLRRRIAHAKAIGEDVVDPRGRDGLFTKPVYISSIRKLFNDGKINDRQRQICEHYNKCVDILRSSRGTDFLRVGASKGSHEGWLNNIHTATAFIDECNKEPCTPLETRILTRFIGDGETLRWLVLTSFNGRSRAIGGRAYAKALAGIQGLLERLEARLKDYRLD